MLVAGLHWRDLERSLLQLECCPCGGVRKQSSYSKD